MSSPHWRPCRAQGPWGPTAAAALSSGALLQVRGSSNCSHLCCFETEVCVWESILSWGPSVWLLLLFLINTHTHTYCASLRLFHTLSYCRFLNTNRQRDDTERRNTEKREKMAVCVWNGILAYCALYITFLKNCMWNSMQMFQKLC